MLLVVGKDLYFHQIPVDKTSLTGCYSHFSKTLHMGQLGNFHQNHLVASKKLRNALGQIQMSVLTKQNNQGNTIEMYY